MDIKEYIQSGLIEQYVLGLATAEDVAELEQLRIQYPELNDAVLNFEKNFEAYLLANPVQPPAFIKSSLETKLFGESPAEKNSDGYITPMYKMSAWRYIAAACIALLVISTSLNFYFYSGYKDSKQQYEALLTERNTLQANNASYKTKFDELNQSLAMMQDTNMVKIPMKGIKGREQNLATIYWDTCTKEVYLLPTKMEKLPEGKQYQLWAIVNGKPVDAGMVEDCTGLCKMKVIDHAEAFAITMEKEGGSTTPTLSDMFVIGKV